MVAMTFVKQSMMNAEGAEAEGGGAGQLFYLVQSFLRGDHFERQQLADLLSGHGAVVADEHLGQRSHGATGAQRGHQRMDSVRQQHHAPGFRANSVRCAC